MPDVLKNPRVRELLASLEESDQVSERSGPSAELDDARRSLLCDLGEAVYTFAKTYGDGLIPIDDEPVVESSMEYTDEVPVDDSDDDTGWYTAEVPRSGNLFDPGDIEDGTTDIPESDSMPAPPPDGTLDYDEDYAVENIARMQFRRMDADNSLGQLRAEPAPTWRHHVDELIALLSLPPRADDPEGMAVEASRVQWASGELENRLSGLPEEVQVCFLGLLAARAQLLRAHLDVGVGPRLALDRIDRYRLANDLPSVAGLQASPRPEYGTWANDARQWYALLAPEPGDEE